ncbi:DUF3616 domain-containing protein [Rufibacter latericius]|uniref:DUF3616 domain-containing protein n=1 Tax=Rufibacter latericius TaxID=2487040 RepID=A0A3M9MPJ5_9BACT|nr:DUF3616 domain-containing protein [Rufibacter latericius]RNI26783.1 DUF3616 domain-containing protein [Rufibacter latericius]
MKERAFSLKLKFDPTNSITATGKHVRDGLSTVLRTGDYLWMSCDEQTTLERLKKTGEHSFGEHVHFDLTQYLDLPDGKNSEIDIEGLGEGGGYLWLVGSHSLKRKKPRKEDSMEKQAKRLAKVSSDPNRYLLARIPLVQDAETGEYTLCKKCSDLDDPSKTLRAAQLVGSKKQNQLMEAFQDDIHLKDFLPIPGKDNGFDIEGMAVHEDRIFVGLRGPVLRGWSMVVELQLEDGEEKGTLQLKPNKDGSLYKKHYLHMVGKGVRELRAKDNDLYILAGPTMDLDGTIAVYRWPNAMVQSLEGEQVVHRKELDHLFDVPHGSGPHSGQDKAEGLGIFDEDHLVVVFDSPREDRKVGENTVLADVYKIKL